MNAAKKDIQPKSAPPFNDRGWILTMFGTAVGAGILYLSIQAGLAGIWALVLLSAFMFPLIYYSHKTVLTMLLSEKNKPDYATVLAGRFGRFFGEGIVIVYFLTFYVLLFSYLVGLIANLLDFLGDMKIITTDYAWGPWLSLLILICFAALYLIGAKIIVRVISTISLVLLVLLFGISVYLIPFWDLTSYIRTPSLLNFIDDILLILPILTISFLFFTAVPPMISAFRASSDADNNNGESRLNRAVLKTTALLLVFVLFFVFSCLLSLTPDAFEKAKETNLTCLSILGGKEGISPVIAKIGPIVGLAALVTSFMGVFFAAHESAIQIARRILALITNNNKTEQPSTMRSKRIDIIVLIGLFASLWILTLINPSVMDIFGLVLSPLAAIFLFILPSVVLIKTHGFTVLRKPSISFVLLTGILVLFSFKLGIILKDMAGL